MQLRQKATVPTKRHISGLCAGTRRLRVTAAWRNGLKKLFKLAMEPSESLSEVCKVVAPVKESLLSCTDEPQAVVAVEDAEVELTEEIDFLKEALSEIELCVLRELDATTVFKGLLVALVIVAFFLNPLRP